jgi:hypothetical protein
VWILGVVVSGSLAGSAPALAEATVAAPSADAVDRARDEVLDDGYQPELPRTDDTPVDDDHPRPPRLRQGGGRLVPVDDQRPRDDAGGDAGPLGTLMSYLVWALVIVGAAVIAVWLGRELAGYTGDASVGDDGAAPEDAHAKAIVERPLGDADELAARGLYTEAIHTLLLRTLQELVRSANVRVAPAQTSREILAMVPLLGDARGALAGLITAVEITHFGGGVPDASDYARCRQQFNVFAAAFRAGPGLAA